MGQRYYRKVGDERIFFEVRNFNGVLHCNCDVFRRTRTCVHTDDVANNNIFVEEEKVEPIDLIQLETKQAFYSGSAKHKALTFLLHNAVATQCEYGHVHVAIWKDCDFRCLQCGEPTDAGLNREQIAEMQSLIGEYKDAEPELQIMWNILEDMKLICI